MNPFLFEKFFAEGLISEESLQRVKTRSAAKAFSLHYELKTILYLGVLLLSGGLGILIYKNIDSIGHGAVVILMLLVSAGCATYCLRTKAPFSTRKVEAPNPFFDYILLLGCLTFITLIGYSQAQFTLFGHRFGLTFFIPMVVLLFSAYYFDHLGILTLGITNAAAWCGIALTPDKVLSENDFTNPRLIGAGLLLGAVLVAVSYLSRRLRIKEHFAFTYANFGAHLLFISCLAALFTIDSIFPLPFIGLMCLAGFFYYKSVQDGSFYFMLILTLYSYIGVSYVVLRGLLYSSFSEGAIYLAFIYFIASAIGLVLFLIRMNKKLKPA